MTAPPPTLPAAVQGPWLTVAEAAKRLGLSEGTIRHWMGGRKIGYRKIGTWVRISESEVLRIEAEGWHFPVRAWETNG